MEWNNILKIAISRGASDVHIRAGLRPIFRIMGTLYPYKEHPPVSAAEIEQTVASQLAADGLDVQVVHRDLGRE